MERVEVMAKDAPKNPVEQAKSAEERLKRQTEAERKAMAEAKRLHRHARDDQK